MQRFFKNGLVIIFSLFLSLTSYAKQPQVWPDQDWESKEPESQGVDSKILTKMLLHVLGNHYDLDSITIIRNGYLIFDVAIPPSTVEQPHPIFSCTKSVTSSLIGIAIDKGFIDGVDTKILGFFPENKIKHVDELKKSITIEHLLTMTSGLYPLKKNREIKRGTAGLFSENDWTQAVLDRQVTDQPGEVFKYNNGGSYLLSAIIQKAVGYQTKIFADKYLFGPIGMSDVEWKTCPKGIAIGGSEITMGPKDMARFGWLYLNNGRWQDRQIISEQWMKASIKPSVTSIGSAAKFDGYGYQWWINSEGYYSAWGAGGQHIYVFPQKRMVVVFTGRLSRSYSFIPKQLLDKFIFKASQSNHILPLNPKAYNRLNKLIDRLNHRGKNKQ